MATVTQKIDSLNKVNLTPLIDRLIGIRSEVDKAAEYARKATPGHEDVPVEGVLNTLQEAKRRGMI